MNVKERNGAFLQGKTQVTGLFPQLDALKNSLVQFEADFGLKDLPEEPGLILVRGARQLGKSTWLEAELKKTLDRFGPGSAFYLNGDEIFSEEVLIQEMKALLDLFPKQGSKIKRVFIDEITAVTKWEMAVKRLYDSGETRDVLIVTTGSKAIDLRKGTERLPGRKGKLNRTNYLFTPLSFLEFEKHCRTYFLEDTLIAYLITGGSPLAANELIRNQGKIPEYVISLTKDWVLGECSAQGRSHHLLSWVARAVLQYGGTPIALAKLAREVGAANNTVLQGYIDLLADLMCLSVSVPVDGNQGRPIPRKAFKYHWTYLLAALSFDPNQMRSVIDFKKMPETEQGKWYEWLVAQELWRRAAIAGQENPELQFFWQSQEHELDFFVRNQFFVEVKRGKTSPFEFQWFLKVFPKKKLRVVSASSFDGGSIQGISFEDFLRGG